MKFLIATTNKGKQAEFAAILSQVPNLELVYPDSFEALEGYEALEDGDSFATIACGKARQYAHITGVFSLCDDTGLEVRALDGLPGIHSKRFVEGTDQDRVKELLKRMKGKEDRSAKFVCALCICDAAKMSCRAFRGEVSGQIALEPAGENGFGYDSVFIPDGFDKTFAQMTAEEKNSISHRGKATAVLANYLQNRYA